MENVFINCFIVLLFFFIIWSFIGLCVFFDNKQFGYDLMSIFGKVIFNFCCGPFAWFILTINIFISTPIVFLINMSASKKLFIWIKKSMYKSISLDNKSNSVDW